jgi:hypothetical protein
VIGLPYDAYSLIRRLHDQSDDLRERFVAAPYELLRWGQFQAELDDTLRAIQDNLGKGGGGPKADEAVVICAAPDTPEPRKSLADFVLTTSLAGMLRRALDALPPSGGTILLLEGTYPTEMSTLFDWNRNNVRLIGCGNGTVINVNPSGGGTGTAPNIGIMVGPRSGSISNIEIGHMKLNVNFTGVGGQAEGIRLTQANNVFIHDLLLIHAGGTETAIRITSGSKIVLARLNYIMTGTGGSANMVLAGSGTSDVVAYGCVAQQNAALVSRLAGVQLFGARSSLLNCAVINGREMSVGANGVMAGCLGICNAFIGPFTFQGAGGFAYNNVFNNTFEIATADRLNHNSVLIQNSFYQFGKITAAANNTTTSIGRLVIAYNLLHSYTRAATGESAIQFASLGTGAGYDRPVIAFNIIEPGTSTTSRYAYGINLGGSDIVNPVVVGNVMLPRPVAFANAPVLDNATGTQFSFPTAPWGANFV